MRPFKAAVLRPLQTQGRRSPQLSATSRRLTRGVVRTAVVAALIVVAVAALPGLGSIRTSFAHADAGWLIAAGCLRLGSALSYAVCFRAIFCPRMPIRLSYLIAMSEVGVNAVVSAGGLGGLALGGWVLHRQGMSAERIAERSAEFFVFTSAFNVGTVALLGWLATLGVFHAHVALALTLVPALVATCLIALALGLLPRLAHLQTTATARGHRLSQRALRGAVVVGLGTRQAVNVFRRREPVTLAGGAGYLFFDIATLWAAVHALHANPAVVVLALSYLVGMLAGELPVPGGIGTISGGLIGALVVYGLPLGVAATATLCYQAVSQGIPIAVGGVAAVALSRRLSRQSAAGAGVLRA